jgi:hypothetical protein
MCKITISPDTHKNIGKLSVHVFAQRGYCEKLHSHFAAPFLNNVDGTEELKSLQYYMIAY